jgi:hypothetical protein
MYLEILIILFFFIMHFLPKEIKKFVFPMVILSQPHFEGSVRSPLTLLKMGVWSPVGLSKTQKTIAGVKTPRIEVFFIPLESS